MRLLKRSFKFLFLGALFLTIASCGGTSGGTGDNCSFTTLIPPNFDLNGTWTVMEISSSSTFECDDEARTYELQITVTGNSISAFSPDLGTTFTGTISGNEIKWTGSFPDDGGTTTVLCAELTASSDSSVSGSATFEFVEDGFECSGSTAITATKN